MKKILLTTLLSVFAVSTVHAANVIDGNPMYRPGEKHFYSETSMQMDTDLELFTLGEEFGYGVTDKMSIFLDTNGSYDSSDTPASGDKYSWNNFLLGTSYRYMDMNEWKADVYGKVQQQYDPAADNIETAWYNWTLGTKVGYMMSDWTFAGTAEANYINDDVDATNYDAWGMKLGLEAQYVMNSMWNMVAGLDYNFTMGNDAYPYAFHNPMNAKLGVNYNIDSTKYVGIYAYKNLKESESDNPYGMGVKFGIDF